MDNPSSEHLESYVVAEQRIPLKHGGAIIVKEHDKRFPFGRRGERILRYVLDPRRASQVNVAGIPGVYVTGGQVECCWDAAPFVSAILGEESPTLPWKAEVPLPGKERYFNLKLNEILRPYQKDGALFLAQRAYAWNALPRQVGKTPTTIAAAVLIDAKKILVVPPEFTMRIWAKQIAQFAQEEAIILQGRACREVRVFCKTCLGRGCLKDGSHCQDCPRKTPGQHLITIEDLRPSYEELVTPSGHPYSPYPATTFFCPRHDEVSSTKPGLCVACQDDLHEAIRKSRWVIVNPELLVPHKASDDFGGEYYRNDLPGWGGILAAHHFDLMIRDEGHGDRKIKLGLEETADIKRRDRVNQVADPIERVWYVTGTPMFGFVRDYWSQLDIMSRGLWSGDWCERLPFAFGKRYCNAQKGEYGWVWDGRSDLAESELKERLKVLTFYRPRSEILPFLPKMTREVIEIEAKATVEKTTRKALKFSKKDLASKESKTSAVAKAMTRSFDVKKEAVIDKVMSFVCEGHKALIFCKMVNSVTRVAGLFDSVFSSREFKNRVKLVNGALWAVHGGQSSAMRHKMAEAFQDHDGGAIFTATMDAFQVGASLASKVEEHPTSTVHFAECHESPLAMAQAEDRPNTVGLVTRGITVFYYFAHGTIDDRIQKYLFPKIEAAAKIAEEESAQGFQTALHGEEKEETIDEILARLTAPSDDDEWQQ